MPTGRLYFLNEEEMAYYKKCQEKAERWDEVQEELQIEQETILEAIKNGIWVMEEEKPKHYIVKLGYWDKLGYNFSYYSDITKKAYSIPVREYWRYALHQEDLK